MEKILNYINGELTAPKSGDYFDNYNRFMNIVDYKEIENIF